MAEERNEPSMEAILSSIKKIIAEDGKPVRRAPEAETDDAPRSRKIEEEEDVLELTETAVRIA